MVDSVFPSYALDQIALDDLLGLIGENRSVWAPRTGSDGVCRLQPLLEWTLPLLSLPTVIPLKKFLLPPREEVWFSHAGQFRAVQVTTPSAIIGVPLCDLQALWYLDQVFAEDELYQSRRIQFLLVGVSCQPTQECRCDRRLMPVAGDVFIDQERVWACSAAGQALLQACASGDPEQKPLPWPDGTTPRGQDVTEEQFAASVDADVWLKEATRCLSCGACSAVCPTCYCFDMLDDVTLDARAKRYRAWDNCFFAEHGLVAGGHDFRPGRAKRLRFRLEHKILGFGALRGQNSCVGCGRCRKACPVDIDLDRLGGQLAEQAAL